MEFRKTSAHTNADELSQLPLPVCPAEEDQVPEIVLLLDHLSDSPVTAHQIKMATARDPLLSSVLRYIRVGWPSNSSVGPELRPFLSRKAELSVQDGCILWGSRVVIPPAYCEGVLLELHEAHPGITRMKSLARMYVWWPGMDDQIEKMVKECRKCQDNQSCPPVAPLHPWKWPTHPWTRLHIDYCGPVAGKLCLVVVDAHTKWIEAFPVSSATSYITIEKLRFLFSQFGLPESVVSDNAAYFRSDEFEQFLHQNGVKHPTSSPYHPASNGLAERAVQTLKNGLKKVQGGSLESRIAKVLFTYRISPHATTGRAPAELLLGRIPRTRLDLVTPNPEAHVDNKQLQQKTRHDRMSKARYFSPGDTVLVGNFPANQGWLCGTVLRAVGPVSFLISLNNGKIVKRHQDHLRHRQDTFKIPHSSSSNFDFSYAPSVMSTPPPASCDS